MIVTRISPEPAEGARAWLDLGPDAPWGEVRAAGTDLEKLGYVTAEIRGAGSSLLRLSGSPLERAEVLRVPGG